MKYDKIITSKYCKEKIEVKVMKPNLCGGFVKRVCYRLWRWFVRTVVEARKRMLRKLSRSYRACSVVCHKCNKSWRVSGNQSLMGV